MQVFCVRLRKPKPCLALTPKEPKSFQVPAHKGEITSFMSSICGCRYEIAIHLSDGCGGGEGGGGVWLTSHCIENAFYTDACAGLYDFRCDFGCDFACDSGDSEYRHEPGYAKLDKKPYRNHNQKQAPPNIPNHNLNHVKTTWKSCVAPVKRFSV